jgi:hypothetical protein
MVLAATVLLLQFLAIPNNSLPIAETPIDAAETASKPSSVAPNKAITTEASPVSLASVVSERSVSSTVPSSKVTYAPGRLVAEPIATSAEFESSSTRAASSAIVVNPQAAENRLQWEQRQKKIWLGLSVLQSSAATFDAWTTRRVIASGKGEERNPLLRPFARNSSLYAAIQVSPLVLDYVGRRMLTSRHGWMRKTWWIPQALGTGMSLASGISNLRVP